MSTTRNRARKAAPKRAALTARSGATSQSKSQPSAEAPNGQHSQHGMQGQRTATMRKAPAPRQRYRTRRFRMSTGIKVAAAIGGALVVLAVIFVVSNENSASRGQANNYAFAVGQPGPHQMAPAIHLPSTAGGSFDLAAQHGKTVLLYFQEGITCEPCWTQIKDIQSHSSAFHALKIDEIVSITTDPLDVLKQKVADESITIPVLSDQTLSVSQTYTANQYGMMGASRDGHTFVVIGPDGRILWRADYGGSPNYTMYVPIDTLLAALRTGIAGGAP